MVGLFNLFAFAAGIIRFADRKADDPAMGRHRRSCLRRAGGDGCARACGVFRQRRLSRTHRRGRRAGRAAGRACLHRQPGCIGGGVPAAGKRRARASGSRKRCASPMATVRMAAGCACACVPSGRASATPRYAVWSIADITRDRERQEDVFQELQHAIEYLDHAPCGFFSVAASGELAYVNATLANWLDYDLAEIGSGGLKLTDIVSGDGASLLTSIVAVPGEVKTEVFDIDLKMRGGKTIPARLYRQARLRRRRRSGAVADAGDRPRPRRALRSRARRRKCASCVSSTTPRWQSPPSIARVRWCAPMRATPSWRRA